jgi:hypothetical protein
LEKSVETDGNIAETMFRSILGKIQYFQTKIGPTVCNATREFAGHLQHPNEEHWKALGRRVGYFKFKNPFILTIRSPEELRGILLADSNYAQCEETRRSVTGGVGIRLVVR